MGEEETIKINHKKFDAMRIYNGPVFYNFLSELKEGKRENDK